MRRGATCRARSRLPRARDREPDRPLRRDDRPRRHRRRERPREPGALRRGRGQAADRADRRSVHRQEADRALARARRERALRIAAGSRRCRACLVAGRDGGARRSRGRRSFGSRAPARDRDGSGRDHDLREPGADGRRGRARAARRGRGAMRALGARLHRDRRGDRIGRAALLLRRRVGRRDPGAVPHGRGAALRARDRGPRTRRARRGRTGAGRAVPSARAARLAEHPQPPARLRALRPPRRVAHRPPPRPRRRGAPAAPIDARARGFPGRPRPRGGTRSAHRWDERRARVGAQRRLRRRRAARDHELPELRQSREA